MRNVPIAAMAVSLSLLSAVAARAQSLTAAAVYSGTSAAVSAIESRESGVIVTRDESTGAESQPEPGAGAWEQPREAAYQDLTDSDWWWENDALTFGYLPGFYGGAFYGGCGGSMPPSWTGPVSTQWWNAPSTNAWFPAGKPLPLPYGPGGYACGAYTHAAQSAVVYANEHAPARKNKHREQSKTRARHSIQAANAASQPEQESADGEWTRLADVRDQRGAADRQRDLVERTPSVRAARISGPAVPARGPSVHRPPAAAAIRVARSGGAARARTALAPRSLAAHPASVHVTAARVGSGHGRT